MPARYRSGRQHVRLNVGAVNDDATVWVNGDRVESYTGMRSIGLKQIDGQQRIVLNGKPTFLLGTLDQGYWPDGIYTAPTDAALKFDLQKTNFRDELRRIETQLQSTTSIIGWVPFNEGWGQWSVQAAADVAEQVKAQDPTRLVDARSGFNCCDTPGDPKAGDVIDWHVYQGPALPAPDATRAAIDGEHGGLTLPIEGHVWPGASLNPYGAVENRAALTRGYVANTKVLRDQGAPYGLSGSVCTQITDVENELNGLFTYDRKIEKPNEARARSINEQVIAAGTRPAPTPPAGKPGLTGVGCWKFDEGQGTTAADGATRTR